METTQKIEIFIDKDKEGTYFDLPFDVPDNISKINVKYSYPRYSREIKDGVIDDNEINIIDLALKDGDGEFIGASGSDREEISISEINSSLGYAETEVKKGKWSVIVGAYKVASDGVLVEYEFTFTHKKRILLKGDLHMHSLGSDGKLTVEEIVSVAKTTGLDYIFITDHNNYFQNYTLKSDDDITVMPGVEWTHYKGHVNMLGIKKAYDGAYYTNTIEETQEKLKLAQEKGAIVSINHPFCPNCGFKWGLENVEYDCIEVWNGPMKKAELDCLAWWHDELCKGRKIPVVGGSDFHRYELGRGIGMPTTCIYSMSKAPSDICAAIRQGCGFITYMVDGPSVYAECDDKILGQTVEYRPGLKIVFEFSMLRKGDIIKIITDKDEEEIICDISSGKETYERQVRDVIFYRTEVYRSYDPGFPSIPALCIPMMISNPIYINNDN